LRRLDGLRRPPRVWFATAIDEAHFLGFAVADKFTHRTVADADTIEELTPEAAPLANRNCHTVRLPERGVRHGLH
jgi:hypothetical protein